MDAPRAILRAMTRGAAAAAALAAGACASGAGPGPIETVSEIIAFTGPTPRDTLTVTLHDPESPDGAAVIVVRDAAGGPVYADAVSLAALAWEEPVETWTAALARERLWLAREPFARTAADLVPRNEAGVGAWWAASDAIEQSDALARARAADRPLLCYVTVAGSSATCAWWDDETGEGVALIEGAS